MTGDGSRSTRLTLVTPAVASPGPHLRFGIEEPARERELERLAGAGPLPFSPDQVVRSRSAVAHATASALGYANAPVAEALRDRAYGSWSGLTMAEVATAEADAFGRWLEEPSAAAPGGESVQDLVDRAQVWLSGLSGSGRTVLAITHPPVVRACLVAALGCPADVWFAVDVGYATRTLLSHSGRRWRVSLVNAAL